jgi:GNAT superfamily N-acetyltransferase
MNSPTFHTVRTDDEVESLAAIARDIWFDYYVPLIGIEQVQYMVTRLQSAPAIRTQLAQGYEYYLVRVHGQSIGYTGMQAQADRSLFISKFYLSRGARGRGTGRRVMAFIEHLAQERGLIRLWLTVNKGNPAVTAYQHLGFHIAEAIVTDIGQGFVMDDYRMVKELSA